ncbi:hypothetical protein CF319_g3753 [Tilletia indica]|nr:hypothetical protein CF319_g3753 [Tilletia indica]
MSRRNATAATGRLAVRDAAREEQVRAHRVSLLSLHPSPAPSTRSPSPSASASPDIGITSSRQRSSRSHLDAADTAALNPPTLASYHSALRYHILALIPTFALILILSWISSTYADLSRHHHPSRKPPLILIPLGAAAWLGAYAVRPLVWDVTDQLLRLLSAPFSFLIRKWNQRRNRKSWARSAQHSPNPPSTIAGWEEEQAGLPQPNSPARTITTLAVSILLRTLIVELLRVGSMALSIAVLDAANRKDHIWLQDKDSTLLPSSVDGDAHSRTLRLSPYDNRFGAVLWTTVGWCSAEWLIGSYDVLRKLRLYHPSLWPSAIYTEPVVYQDNFSDRTVDDDEDHDDGEHAEEDENLYNQNDEVDREAAFPRTRTRASQAQPGSSGIEAATTAAQAAVHAVRFFPRVFTQTSTKSSSSSAFTVRPLPSSGGGTANASGSAYVLPSTQPSGLTSRRRAATQTQRREVPESTNPSAESLQDQSEDQGLLTNAQPSSAHHEQFSTALNSTYSAGGAYGTFQTARTHQPAAFLSRLQADQDDSLPAGGPSLGPVNDDEDETDHYEHPEPVHEEFVDLDPEEEAALQSRLAHALAILLAARERADLEETLGARLDVQVRPALAALWRIDGFVWNLGECLLMAAAVAITSDGWVSKDGKAGEGWNKYYETVPDLGASPLLPTWLVLTALHTILSMLWATALPRLGFALVSYASLLLGMGLTVAGLAWWGVLV